jgi:hypothetical protein
MQHSLNSANSPRARRLSRITSVSALAWLSACNGSAYNLGADAPVGAEESTCNVDVDSSDTIFALNQADVDALRGCRSLPGSLQIRLPEAEQDTFTLTPLAELENIHGQLSIVGPFKSLAGLEALEQVGSVELRGLLVSDLTALRGLRRVAGEAIDPRLHGMIRIEDCDHLTDLIGLENLTTWTSLNIIGLDDLVALTGLQAPPRVEQFELNGTPQLSDVSALAPVEELAQLMVWGTAVATFEPLRLRRADTIQLFYNHALTDLDGLSDLRRVGNLMIGHNDALERVELPSLREYEGITIVGNAVLQAVPHYDTSTGNAIQPTGPVDPVLLRAGQLLFEVGDNAQLKSIIMPTVVGSVEQVAIYQNPSLSSLDMLRLVRSDNIWIQDNAILDSVAAPWLERVADLAIRNNPALSVAPFANVQTFTRDVTGNLDDLAP